MADDDFSDFLNCYTSQSVTSAFDKKIEWIKANNNTKVGERITSTVEIKKTPEKLCIPKDPTTKSPPDPFLRDCEVIHVESEFSGSSSSPPADLELVKEVPIYPRTRSKAKKSIANQLRDCEVIHVESEFSGSSSSPPADLELVKEVPISPRTRSKAKKSIAASSARKTRKKKAKVVEVTDSEEIYNNDNLNYETNIKILWKSVNVIRVPVRRLQKLSIVFQHLMKEENVDLDQIVLTFNGTPINSSDTPDSLNLNICDFLEGGIVEKGQVTAATSKKEKTPKFYLTFQFEAKKTIPLAANKNEPMEKIMLLFSEQIEKPLSSIRFYVDGEEISPTDTPASLDLEKGDIIDVSFVK